MRVAQPVAMRVLRSPPRRTITSYHAPGRQQARCVPNAGADRDLPILPDDPRPLPNGNGVEAADVRIDLRGPRDAGSLSRDTIAA